MDSARPSISVIALDEDAEILREISRLLVKVYRVLATDDAKVALRWLEADRTVKILIVDQNLHLLSGLDVLNQAKILRPDVRRVLITQYDDLSGIVQGLHSDVVNRTISKPIHRTELAAAMALNHESSATPLNRVGR